MTAQRPPVLRVREEQDGPLVVCCGACGGAAQRWAYKPAELLPWQVIEHWLTHHWDQAGLDEGAEP